MTTARTVLLLNPPHRERVVRDCYCSHVTKGAYYWHPLDLMVQSALLSGAGRRVEVMDAIVDRLDERRVLASIERRRPDWVLMLVGECVAGDDLSFAARLRRAMPETRLIGSGDLFMGDPAAALKAAPAFDGALLDFASPALMDLVAGREPRGDLAWRDAEGVRVLPRRAEPTLTFPTPPEHWFGKDRYRLPFYGRMPFHSVMTNYGCPFGCRFCHIPALGYRERALDEVTAEIATALGHGRRRLYFRDANFGVNRAETLALCDWLAARPERPLWNAFVRTDMADEELLAAMARAGCRIVQTGVETLDRAAAAGAGKPSDASALRDLVARCHAHDIRVSLHFLFGLPGDAWVRAPRAADELIALGADYLSVNILTARSGAKWSAAEMTLDDQQRRQWRRLSGEINRRFYLRPMRLWQELVWMRTPANIWFSAVGFLTALVVPGIVGGAKTFFSGARTWLRRRLAGGGRNG